MHKVKMYKIILSYCKQNSLSYYTVISAPNLKQLLAETKKVPKKPIELNGTPRKNFRRKLVKNRSVTSYK